MSRGLDHMDAIRRAQADRLTDPAECSPDEVEFVVRWSEVTASYLKGSVTATNSSQRPWRITGKPVALQITADGRDLPVHHKVRATGRTRDWIVVRPGAAVQAPLSITGWEGTERADYLEIRWPGGRKQATVHGPTHPAEPSEGRVYSSSSWFRPVNLSLRPPGTRIGVDHGTTSGETAPGHTNSAAEIGEIAAFARARLADTRGALLALHRSRCGTPPTAFALDQNGSRYVPSCQCDRDIRRSLKDLRAQHHVINAASERSDDVLGSRILRTLAGTFADHPDFRPEWARPT